MNKRSAGGILVLVFVLMALLAPAIARHDPNLLSLPDRLAPPSADHWLGQDENGADVFAILVYGSRVSLAVAFSVVGIGLILGLTIGSLSALSKGWGDLIIMRITDIFYAFPGFLIALSLVAVLGASLSNLVLAMAITSWAPFARLVRAEVLRVKELEHIQSARALGAGPLRILFLHIWPSLLGVVAVQSTFALAGTIISESGLSFLGLGVSSDTPTWGGLLNSGRRVLLEAPQISLAPGIAILLLVLGFNLLGDGLRDRLDPRRGQVRV
ncbi:MAG: ABC transporter permease [Bdellovibrionales bacterium]